LHSVGFIHSDLRPKNFLIDEYGILKLCDFKFTVKIPKERLDDKPIETRGTPPYMAPELFTSEGVHSFQSDFWAVGCLFYELRRGQAPFGGPTMALDKLMNNIRSVEPIHSPLAIQSSPVKEKTSSRSNQASNNNNTNNMPSFSVELADLLLWLLEKAPMNRCVWLVSSSVAVAVLLFINFLSSSLVHRKDLATHPFWKPSKFAPPADLPPQPVFDKLIRELEKSRSEQLELASNTEFNISLDDIQAYNNSLLTNQSFQQQQPQNTLLLPGGGLQDNTPMKKMLPSVTVDSTPLRPDGAAAKNSRRSKSNGGLTINEMKEQKENDEKNSSSSLSTQVTPSRAIIASNTRNNNNNNNTVVIPTSQTNKRPDEAAREKAPVPVTKLEIPATGNREMIMMMSNNNNNNTGMGSVLPTGTPMTLINQRTPMGNEKGAGVGVSGLSSDQFQNQLAPDSLLMHASDTQVKPIVGNKAIEVMERTDFIESTLPFEVVRSDQLQKLSQTDLEVHLTQVRNNRNQIIFLYFIFFLSLCFRFTKHFTKPWSLPNRIPPLPPWETH
jgi:serine/threonine protein kinase